LKVIRERPSAIFSTKFDKTKSPVSSPVLSPKNKEKPTSPRGNLNKNLAVSAVNQSDNQVPKPANKFAVSSVSRRDG
jgi:hypothetical protein